MPDRMLSLSAQHLMSAQLVTAAALPMATATQCLLFFNLLATARDGREGLLVSEARNQGGAPVVWEGPCAK